MSDRTIGRIEQLTHTPGLPCGHDSTINSKGRCRACQAILSREWRQANPSKARAHRRQWRARKGAAYEATRKRIRRRNNPGTAAAAADRRRRWLAAGDVTRDQLVDIYCAAGGSCRYCGASVRARFTPTDPRGFDHVTPRIAGGLHTAANLVVSCGPCNAAKAEGREA